VRNLSTVTNVLHSETDWTFGLDAKKNIDIIFLDLSKVFDTVVHNKLIFILSTLGIADNSLI